MKLSIITINYNNHEGLERTFRSVFSQSFKDFEYVVIDGGSNDGSKELIEKNSDKIQYWVSEKDKGIYNAMNKGIAAAKGEYLLFLNSGDELFDNEVVKKVVPKLLENDIITGDIEFVYENSIAIGISPETVSFKLFVEDTVWHPCSFIKKKCFETAGKYDENLKIVSDWKWFLDGFSKFGFSYQHINQMVSRFFVDGISSKNHLKVEKERAYVLNNNYTFFLKDYLEQKKTEKALLKIKDNSSYAIIERAARKDNRKLQSLFILLSKKFS